MDREVELEFENKVLRSKINELESELVKFKKIIKDNDLDGEFEPEDLMSDEEFVCVNEIKKLKQLSEQSGLTKDDVQSLDILHKNLRMIRGMKPEKKNKKKANISELFKIVEGSGAETK